MEFAMPISKIKWDQLRNFGIIGGCVVLAAFILIIYISHRKKKGNPVNKNQVRLAVLSIIVFNIILGIYVSEYARDILYIFDVNNEDYIKASVFIMDTDYTRDSCTIFDQNDGKYIFNNESYSTKKYSEINKNMEENFVGHVCEIEYFRLSRYLIRITVID